MGPGKLGGDTLPFNLNTNNNMKIDKATIQEFLPLIQALAAGKLQIDENYDSDDDDDADWGSVSSINFDLSPSAYRVKPEIKRVQLTEDDIINVPGIVFKDTYKGEKRTGHLPVAVDHDGIYIRCQYDLKDKFITFEALMNHWQMRLPGITEWQPCFKEETV